MSEKKPIRYPRHMKVMSIASARALCSDHAHPDGWEWLACNAISALALLLEDELTVREADELLIEKLKARLVYAKSQQEPDPFEPVTAPCSNCARRDGNHLFGCINDLAKLVTDPPKAAPTALADLSDLPPLPED